MISPRQIWALRVDLLLGSGPWLSKVRNEQEPGTAGAIYTIGPLFREYLNPRFRSQIPCAQLILTIGWLAKIDDACCPLQTS